MPIYCYVFPVRFYYSETNTGGDVAFRHVERKLVCVFMVTVTFCCFRFGWTTKKDHFIVFTYLLLFLCCVFCSDVTWSLFVQKKREKKIVSKSWQKISKQSHISEVCCHLHIGLKARNSTICTHKSFLDVVWFLTLSNKAF